MISIKTLKLNEDDRIVFNFTETHITIKIIINDTINNLSRFHNEFNDTLNELPLNIFQSKKIRYWYYKNYKRIFPKQDYTTKYGRIIHYEK